MLLYRRAISFTTLAHTHSEKYYKRHDKLYYLYLLLLFFFLNIFPSESTVSLDGGFCILELKIYRPCSKQICLVRFDSSTIYYNI